jgi:hypothetical protein
MKKTDLCSMLSVQEIVGLTVLKGVYLMEETAQEGLTKAQIAKALGITVRTLDRKRQEGKIILTSRGKNRYLYTIKEETDEPKEQQPEEPQEQQESQQQEATTDQATALQTLIQSFRQSFRSTIDQDLDSIDEQLAELQKHTDQQTAALEDQIAKLRVHIDQQAVELRAYTDQRLAELEKCLRILERIIRQHYGVEHNGTEHSKTH